MNRREFLKEAALAVPMAAGGCAAQSEHVRIKSFAFGPSEKLTLPVGGLREPVRFFVAGDTHFPFHDERDDAFRDNYRRMAGWGGAKEPFERMLADAKAKKVDLLCLVGDTISFPTLANVEYVDRTLRDSGLPWLYTAGNHDWHYEGVSGADEAQRAEWTKKRLMPLYQGANPLFASRVTKGVRFVAIDNSIYHVNEEQLAFWKSEAVKGDPVVLLMHIPLWTEGWDFFTCGNAEWGSAVDPYWKIERRQKWAERQSPSTFAFREAVLATPNLVGVFTGHRHQLMVAQRPENQLFFSVPGNDKGARLEVDLVPAD